MLALRVLLIERNCVGYNCTGMSCVREGAFVLQNEYQARRMLY